MCMAFSLLCGYKRVGFNNFIFIFLCGGLFSVWCAASVPPPPATGAAPAVLRLTLCRCAAVLRYYATTLLRYYATTLCYALRCAALCATAYAVHHTIRIYYASSLAINCQAHDYTPYLL